MAMLRSGRWPMFFKMGAPKNFTIFTRKTPVWSLFSKTDFNTGGFLGILRSSQKQLLYLTHPVAASLKQRKPFPKYTESPV